MVPYEILWADSSDKEASSNVLPMLNQIMSYPNTIILDKKNNIRKIITGFNGPATSLYEEDIKKFDELLKFLIADKELPEEYKDHLLIGNYKGFRECHIEPNWLIIYEKTETTIFFVRMGTHSDLFKNK